jgi:broad specificity phosphatase PhoE
VAEILLARHGETEWSRAHRHTGRSDLPLTALGREQARRLGALLEGRRFAVVLASPLARARETCELAGFGDDAVLSEDLLEWDYGEYEGLTSDEIRRRRPGWSLWRDGCPGGERPADVGARADRALGALRDADGDALVFAHGHFLRVLAARFVGLAAGDGGKLALDVATLSVLGHEHADDPVIRAWNAAAIGDSSPA